MNTKNESKVINTQFKESRKVCGEQEQNMGSGRVYRDS